MPIFTIRRTNAVAALALVAFVLTAVSAILQPITAQAAPVSVSGSLNVTATVLPSAPTTQAVITQPVSGTRVQTTPMVLLGTCGPGLLVRVFNNDILAGSITCSAQGDFVMNITLDIGENVLTSLNFDAFEQAGPNAPAVTIYVDEPAATEEVGTPGTIEADGTINTSQTNEQSQSNGDYQRIFEGTIVEPLAKALDVSAIVSPSFNSAVTLAMNSIFVLAVFALLAILLL